MRLSSLSLGVRLALGTALELAGFALAMVGVSGTVSWPVVAVAAVVGLSGAYVLLAKD